MLSRVQCVAHLQELSLTNVLCGMIRAEMGAENTADGEDYSGLAKYFVRVARGEPEPTEEVNAASIDPAGTNSAGSGTGPRPSAGDEGFTEEADDMLSSDSDSNQSSRGRKTGAGVGAHGRSNVVTEGRPKMLDDVDGKARFIAAIREDDDDLTLEFLTSVYDTVERMTNAVEELRLLDFMTQAVKERQIEQEKRRLRKLKEDLAKEQQSKSEKIAIPLSDEDRFMETQVAIAAGEGMSLQAPGRGVFDEDEVVEVELNENRPGFIRKLAGQMKKEARERRFKAQQEGAFDNREEEQKAKQDAKSMVSIAKRQQDLSRERKAVKRYEDRQAQRSDVIGVGDDSTVEVQAPSLTFGRRFGLDRLGKNVSAPMREQRQSLPIFQLRDQLLELVDKNRVTVVVGETGSGKTTQMPQYLAEHGYCRNGRRVACTQPRRVAAISVAERVSEEVGCEPGQEVGYSVRFADKTSSRTMIKYMTEGMLLREALLDDDLNNYSVIVLDEAHERSTNVDVLFGVLKQVMKRREDLKIIVTSATLEVEKFCGYFGADDPFRIPGRMYDVEVLHTQEPVVDYFQEALEVVMKIHLTEPPGDVLVFFTGQEEIETAAEKLNDLMKKLPEAPEMIILPIYSALPSEMQSKVFEKTPEFARKVVLATNIVETSITLDNLYYVVDPGYCKMKMFDPRKGVEALQVLPISQSQAKQRAGRAGRTGPGRCYRLYTQLAHDTQMKPSTVPEIQRSNMANIVLQLKAIGIHNVLEFDFMDPPSPQTLIVALEKLYALGALDGEGVLTRLGRRMSEFPVEPGLSKTLLTAAENDCLNIVLSIVALLSSTAVFYRPKDKQEEADRRRARFFRSEGDHFMLLAAYEAWMSSGSSPTWCKANFMHFRALKDASDIRSQLYDIISKRGAVPDAGKNFTAARKAITAGSFFHAARREGRGYRTLKDNNDVQLHRSSAVFNTRPQYVVYHELVETSAGEPRMEKVMAIDHKWLPELAPAYYAVCGKARLSKVAARERLTPMGLSKEEEKGGAWRISRQRKTF